MSSIKGHGMELSLNKNSNISSNDTPTPTRFIRNCEAIGLFQDLNPFEETFKKAVENVKRGTLKTQSGSVLSKSAGDELHTPQVYLDGTEPHNVEIDESERIEEVEVVVRSEADTSASVEPALPPSFSSAKDGHVSDESVQVLFQMPNGTVLQLSAKPVKNDSPQIREAIRIAPVKTVTSETILVTRDVVTPPLKPSPTTPHVKEKLKAFLDGSIKAKQEKEAPKLPPKQVSIPSLKAYKNTYRFDDRPLIADPVNETDEDRKRKILERNRRAASRCREKRKRRVELLENDNKMLTQEVTALRQEVLRLQTLLMMHVNCPLMTSSQSSEPALFSTAKVLAKPVHVVPVEPLKAAVAAATLKDSNPALSPKRAARSRQQRKKRLTLDIVKATKNTMMDLDSPSIVKKDEVLGSVGPPCTPDERIDPFVDLERDMAEPFDKHFSSTTTVIQLNPNVLKGSQTS